MSIEHADFRVFEREAATFVLSGSLRLNAAPEYQPISDFLNAGFDRVSADKTCFVLDLRELKFLNSSGINLLYQFVLRAKKGGSGVKVLGSQQHAWQPKSLQNMVKFMPALELVMS